MGQNTKQSAGIIILVEICMKKSEKTEITIAKILDAAMKEFGKNGYAGGTINHICNAGINKGLIYHNFAGKDELHHDLCSPAALLFVQE